MVLVHHAGLLQQVVENVAADGTTLAMEDRTNAMRDTQLTIPLYRR